MAKTIQDMTRKQTTQKDLNNTSFKCWRKCKAKNCKSVTLEEQGQCRRQWCKVQIIPP